MATEYLLGRKAVNSFEERFILALWHRRDMHVGEDRFIADEKCRPIREET